MRENETKNRKYMNADYISGNVALSPERVARPERQKSHITEVDAEAKVKPRVGRGINFFSMVFLAVACVATLYFCIEYLQIQADIVKLKKEISGLENTYESIAKENEAFSLALDAEAPDLEYVYNTAVGFLGMVYPNHNDVRYYKSYDKGYYRQYGDIKAGN